MKECDQANAEAYEKVRVWERTFAILLLRSNISQGRNCCYFC